MKQMQSKILATISAILSARYNVQITAKEKT